MNRMPPRRDLDDRGPLAGPSSTWSRPGAPMTISLATADRRPDRSVLVADHQTAGRGRLDRRWEAPPGANLLVSILFHVVPDPPGELTRRVGLAAIAAVRRRGGRAGRAEVAERRAARRRQAGGHPGPADRRRVGRRGSRAERRLGARRRRSARQRHRTRSTSSPPCSTRIDALPVDVGERYRQHLATLGRRVHVELPDGVLDGTATDVEPDGRLVVVDACGVTHRVDAGDVIHVR